MVKRDIILQSMQDKGAITNTIILWMHQILVEIIWGIKSMVRYIFNIMKSPHHLLTKILTIIKMIKL
jgi:hypothetical protein